MADEVKPPEQANPATGVGTPPPADVKPETTPQTTPATEPEKYTLTAPAGSALDADEVKAIEAYGLENKLSKEAAQKELERIGALKGNWVKKAAEDNKKAVEAAQRTMDEEQKKTEEGWITATKADNTIGGEKFAEHEDLIKRHIKAAGGEKLEAIVVQSRVMYIPEVFGFLLQSAKAAGNDTFVKGGATNTDNRPDYIKARPNMDEKGNLIK